MDDGRGMIQVRHIGRSVGKLLIRLLGREGGREGGIMLSESAGALGDDDDDVHMRSRELRRRRDGSCLNSRRWRSGHRT